MASTAPMPPPRPPTFLVIVTPGSGSRCARSPFGPSCSVPLPSARALPSPRRSSRLSPCRSSRRLSRRSSRWSSRRSSCRSSRRPSRPSSRRPPRLSSRRPPRRSSRLSRGTPGAPRGVPRRCPSSSSAVGCASVRGRVRLPFCTVVAASAPRPPAESALEAATAARATRVARLASLRSLSTMSRTIAPMSRGAAPRRVRRRTAARWIRRNNSSKSSTPLATGIAPPATHASRASAPMPKSGASPRVPPPACACARLISSPSRAAPSRMSPAACSPVVVPHRPPHNSLSNDAARDSDSSGGCPASSLTAGASERSADITLSTKRATSSATSGRRSSPTTSSTRSRSSDARPWRAARTDAGTVPSAGRLPAYLPFEKIAAHAASPRATDATAPVGARASASALSVSSSHSGCSTAASAARRAAVPVSERSCASLLVDPAGKSRSERRVGRSPPCACPAAPLVGVAMATPSAAARRAATSTSRSLSAALAMSLGCRGGG
eukprot:5242592-Pleurochrysis_carterae.AAC.1